jgi:hypothetical protein
VTAPDERLHVEPWPEEVREGALDAAVREHFESRHSADLCVPFEQIGERSRRIVREQKRGTVEAVLAAPAVLAHLSALYKRGIERGANL